MSQRRAHPDGTRSRARRSALPQSRRGRTVAAVAAATATTAGGHLLATGAAPPLTGLLLAVVLMALPAWWLTRDERGWERLAVAQLVAQLGGHALFVATASDPAAHAGHGVLGSELVVIAHVLGAVVAGAWLRCGERRAVAAARHAVTALWRLLRTMLGEWRTVRRPAPTRPPGAPTRDVLTARLRHSIVHRGPPAGRRELSPPRSGGLLVS
jgi:hypothetical protein